MELKPGYKQTEVGVIPEEWEVTTVSSLGNFTSGKGISIAGLHGLSSDYPVPVFGGNGIAGYTTTPFVCEPTVVIGRVGQKCGAVYLTDGPAWITDNALYPKTISRPLDIRFLARALEAAGLNDVKNRNDLPLVTQSILNAVRLAWPPNVSEQRTIAAALSDVDAFLAKLDQLIAKKREIKQAAMQQLLTGKKRLPGFSGVWEVKRLGDIAEIVMGQSPSSANYNAKGMGLPLIQGNADIANRKTIRRIFTTEITKRGKCGDILMSVRAPVGEISRAVFDVCLGRGVCAIRYANDFMYHYLISQEPSWAKLSKGSTFDSVNSADVKALEVCLPNDAHEQTAIAAVLSDMDAEIAALEARCDKTRDLKQGMMQELLIGRIRLV